jgi:hypothetical protein
MLENERHWVVKRLLFDYVKSPSLRHIRDPHSIAKLTLEIVRAIDRTNSIWQKWDGNREVVAKSAVGCWIPTEDLREFLDQMPGPPLTTTDVEQRIRTFEDEHYYAYPKADLQAGCLALYEKEKTAGTEMPAIIGVLRDHVEREEERLRVEQREQYERWKADERQAREERLLSGADCKWTQLPKSPDWFCRTNGRTFRLSPTKDKLWNLYSVTSVEDEKGSHVGKYARRGDASKVITELAFKPEPRW